MELTNTIRKYRFENGEMTQKQLAETVGVSRQTMNAIENGHHAPRLDVAIRIADVFRLSVDRLFELKYDGRPEPDPKPIERTIEREEPVQERPIADMNQRVSAGDSGEAETGGVELNKSTRAMLRGLMGA